ncbi:MAG: hypothetical protein FJ118_03340 [Deltaproteobacteria bacterium]|nr:hypothetical protein [Deltaproteobacteria bacterium]
MSSRELEARVPVECPDGAAFPAIGPTYREYLNCVERAVLQNLPQIVELAARHASLPERDPMSIQIITEKHGSDYHPARVRLRAADRSVSFVMNVALNERGRTGIEREFHVIRNLNKRFESGFLPHVYLLLPDMAPWGAESPRPVSMFLGEWLDGYHEFHLAAPEQDALLRTILWDMDNGYRACSERETKEIYRRAAYILSYYYDPDTYEEIYPWHHASGDFVARPSSAGADVKLIAARQYAARSALPTGSPENRLDALWAFFANLTIRMRLDRLDGVGEVVWAGDHCLESAIRGFSESLRDKMISGSLDTNLYETFVAQAARISPADLARLFRETVESYDSTASETPVIRQRLADHIFRAYQLLAPVISKDAKRCNIVE